MDKLLEKIKSLRIIPYFVQKKTDGLLLGLVVNVKTRAKKENVLINQQGELVISTCARPIDGKANKALRKIISSNFGIAVSNILIERGEKSKRKSFLCNFPFKNREQSGYYVNYLEKNFTNE